MSDNLVTEIIERILTSLPESPIWLCINQQLMQSLMEQLSPILDQQITESLISQQSPFLVELIMEFLLIPIPILPPDINFQQDQLLDLQLLLNLMEHENMEFDLPINFQIQINENFQNYN